MPEKRELFGELTVLDNLQLGGTMVSISGGTYSGNIQTSGEITAGTIALKTHRHTGVQTGGGTSGGPTP